MIATENTAIYLSADQVISIAHAVEALIQADNSIDERAEGFVSANSDIRLGFAGSRIEARIERDLGYWTVIIEEVAEDQ